MTTITGTCATADDLASATLHDPVTEEEQKMFDAMYGDAGLDDDSLNTLKNGWKQFLRRAANAVR